MSGKNPFLGLGLHSPFKTFSSEVLAFLEYTTASVSAFQIKTFTTPNYDVDWGDGSTDTGVTSTTKDHTYSTAGVYTIKITPASGSTFQPEHYNSTNFATNLTKVRGKGGSELGTTLQRAYRETTSLTTIGAFDTSGVTHMIATFNGCTGLTSFPLINTSNVVSLNNCWTGCSGLTSFPLIDTSSTTDLNGTWTSCTSLTSFPSINTGSCTNFTSTWRDNRALTSFPSIDCSSGTVFVATWRDCNALTTYPANQFDNTGTLASNAFSNTWLNCALTAQSIENILTSLDTNGSENITLTLSGGTNAAKSTWTAAANTAYTNLVNKGWTISYNA